MYSSTLRPDCVSPDRAHVSTKAASETRSGSIPLREISRNIFRALPNILPLAYPFIMMVKDTMVGLHPCASICLKKYSAFAYIAAFIKPSNRALNVSVFGVTAPFPFLVRRKSSTTLPAISKHWSFPSEHNPVTNALTTPTLRSSRGIPR
ncbi:unnamed protein product [Chondrus crispus]|uniref:Uncharacterized protein n=1 Tax=Chondrus crispus TaxID=2769 RepID=R7QF65_CHOCR|nr:unnamed protein product [Chondrus crispus]CDF37167.1 unnamed protein product [Chondrus crispus]|eukprot:XP_005716986.1 unnamed protein product [Chondrus crispus]